MNVILDRAFRARQPRAGVISAADLSTSTSRTNASGLIMIVLGGGGELTVPTTDLFYNGAVEDLAQTNPQLFFERFVCVLGLG